MNTYLGIDIDIDSDIDIYIDIDTGIDIDINIDIGTATDICARKQRRKATRSDVVLYFLGGDCSKHTHPTFF